MMNRDNYLNVLSSLMGASVGRSSARTVFQLSALAGSSGKTVDDDAKRCVRITVQWLQDMLHGTLARETWTGSPFSVEEPGRKAECIAVPEVGLWTLRVELSDVSHNTQPEESGRSRVTDISFARRNNCVAFGLRVLGGGPVGQESTIRSARPRIIADIAHQIGLKECRAIEDSPWLIQTDEELDELHNLLIDPLRTLPVIVLSQTDKRRWSVPVSDFVLDPQLLAEQALGMAHIVQLPWEMGFKWSEKVGKQWSVYLGSVRVYQPYLDFGKDDIMVHPLYLTEKILFWRHDGLLAENAFTAFLVETLEQHAASKRVNWEDRLFITDARAKAAELESERLAREQMNRKPVSYEDHEQQIAAIQAEIDLIRAAHTREVEALRAKIQEVREEAEEYNDDAIRAEKEREYFREENSQLRVLLNDLRVKFFKQVGYDVDPEMIVPDGYEEMPEWVSRHLAGRLILHPRALQGIKGAVYEDVFSVYEVLLILANQYRNMKLGGGSREDFQMAVDRLQLRSGKSISEIRAGEEGMTYYVKYPLGSSTTRFLEMHLRSGGNSRDPHRCLAVYFFWDEDTQQVVVGWLPSHLENRLT